MQKLFLLLFLFIYSFSFSQELARQYSNLISPDSLKNTVLILASDSLEGRETGKTGQKKSAFFLARNYYRLGLTPKGLNQTNSNNPELNEESFLQYHPISVRNNKSRNISLNGENFLFGKDFFYHSFNIDSFYLINEVKYFGNGKFARTDKIFSLIDENKVPNIILDDTGPKTQEILFERISQNKMTGVSIVFCISPEEKIAKLFLSKKKPVTTPKTPIIYISKELAEAFFKPGKYKKISSKLKRTPKTIIKKQSCQLSFSLVRNHGELNGENVIAMIPGSDLREETVVISSHYDHLGKKDSLIYYGADDNASGTSAVLEMARVFQIAKKDGNGPRRNLLFLNVSGEEKGLLGSAWFVNNPTVPLHSIVTNLNIDMIGRTDAEHDSTGVRNYVYIIGSNRMSNELHAINETMNDSGPRLELNYKYNNTNDPNDFYRRSDHYNFIKKNIPAIFYFNGTHVDYHKPTDTADKIDFSLLSLRAGLIFMTAWELANRNDRVVIDKKENQDEQ